MKLQISITIEEEILVKTKEKLQEGLFKNKSHISRRLMLEMLKYLTNTKFNTSICLRAEKANCQRSYCSL
jgi:Arc/MetJ-type ribon-helix-helix transcriptional regulator